MYPSLPKVYMLKPAWHLISGGNDNLRFGRDWFGFLVWDGRGGINIYWYC